MIKVIVIVGLLHSIWAGAATKQVRIGLGKVNQKSSKNFPIDSEAPAGLQIEYQWKKNISARWQRGVNMGWGTFAQASPVQTNVIDNYYVHPNMSFNIPLVSSYSLAFGSAAGLSVTEKRNVDRGETKSDRRLSYGVGGSYGVSLIHSYWSISAEVKHVALFKSDTFSWREVKIGYAL